MTLSKINYNISCIGIFFLLLFSCTDNSTAPDDNEPDDEISGTYFLEGYQVNLDLCYVGQNCEGNEVLSRDTVQRSFSVEIELVNNRTDTLLFKNLEGADIGIKHPEYSGHAADVDCPSSSPDYCAYAHFQNNALQFNIVTQPGEYFGTGTLSNEKLTLETSFRHRGAGVDYVLSGVKQEN
jgi:hypothetical protein